MSIPLGTENHIHVLGDTGDIAGNGSESRPREHYISTPFFPLHYPRDYEVEYSIGGACDECQVHVNFIDFQLAPVSVLEVRK